MSNKNLKQPSPSLSQSLLEELKTLGTAELRERYLNTFQKEATDDLTDDMLISAIVESAPKAPPKEMAAAGADAEPKSKAIYGNKDSKKEYPIQKDWLEKVVVRQVKIDVLNGGKVEVPNTEELQTYDPMYFEKLLKDNFFGDSKMDVQILHQPKK